MNWLELLVIGTQTVAIIVGGLYAYYEYRRFRRFRPKVQFDVDFTLHPIAHGGERYLLDVQLTVINRGHVRKYFPKILVGVKALRPEDVDAALETRKQVRFGEELVKKHNIVPDPSDPWWVDSGVTQVFPYPLIVEGPGDFVQVNAAFYYYRGREEEAYHKASLVRPVARSQPS